MLCARITPFVSARTEVSVIMLGTSRKYPKCRASATGVRDVAGLGRTDWGPWALAGVFALQASWGRGATRGRGLGLGLGRLDFGEGGRGVREAGGVYLAGGTDEGLDLGCDIPDVDVHARDDAAVVEPEGDELEGVAVAAIYDLVVAAGQRQARAFHAEVVLVAVEVGHPVVLDLLAEHRLGGRLAAVERVRPVIHAQVAAEHRVVGARHVAGGEDVLT